jgi:acylphosphatase
MRSLEQHLEGRPQEVAKTMKRSSAQERVEREMLKLLARDADTYREFVGKLSEDHFRSAPHRAAFEALRDADGDVSALVAGADEKLAALISALTVEPLEGELHTDYARDVWRRLQEFLMKGRSDALRSRLQKMNPTVDAAYDELFAELVAVDGELRRLRSLPDLAS